MIEGKTNDVYCVVKRIGDTKKTKTDKGESEFAILFCEDKETGEDFKLLTSLQAFAEIQEGDLLLLKHFYAKPDKYSDEDEEVFALSKGKHGQLMKIPTKRGEGR